MKNLCMICTQKLLYLLSRTAIKMTIINDRYVLYCHTYLNTTNYCWKMVWTKTVPDRPPWENVRLYQLCVASNKWDSINCLWDWAFLLAFVRWPKCQVQLTAIGQSGEYQLEISWWKIGVMKNLTSKIDHMTVIYPKLQWKRQSDKKRLPDCQ